MKGSSSLHPPPKLVWEQDEGYPVQAINRHFGNEMVEARKQKYIKPLSLQSSKFTQLPVLPSSSSLPFLDTLPESRHCHGLPHQHPSRSRLRALSPPLRKNEPGHRWPIRRTRRGQCIEGMGSR
ncbi:uncharacterized protein CEXT_607811 [Caerostris extrusa]|uniref:Uncharacterized protein n=1 Tax=Caerostris extrusa TaxID=172846 RepID=A0AAV4MVI2_CAEEX|nr:uncharacterized protein CEXT_607811 [Caerostris extrusa]